MPIDDDLAATLTEIRTEDELCTTRRHRTRSPPVARLPARVRSGPLLGARARAVRDYVRSRSASRRRCVPSAQRRPRGSPAARTSSTPRRRPRRIGLSPSESEGILLTWGPIRRRRPGADLPRRGSLRHDALGPRSRRSGPPRRARPSTATAVDTEPFTGANRFYAVFVNAGPTEAAARASRPVLWAEGTAIQPVHGAQISTTGRRVSGRWTVSPRPSRVEILRVPVQDPPIPAGVYDTDYVISGTRPGENLDGFSDEDVPSGSWEYRLYACAAGQRHDAAVLARCSPYKRSRPSSRSCVT